MDISFQIKNDPFPIELEKFSHYYEQKKFISFLETFFQKIDNSDFSLEKKKIEILSYKPVDTFSSFSSLYSHIASIKNLLVKVLLKTNNQEKLKEMQSLIKDHEKVPQHQKNLFVLYKIYQIEKFSFSFINTPWKESLFLSLFVFNQINNSEKLPLCMQAALGIPSRLEMSIALKKIVEHHLKNQETTKARLLCSTIPDEKIKANTERRINQSQGL